MPRGRPAGLTPAEADILRAGVLAAARTGGGRFWAFEVQKVFTENRGRPVSWGTLFPALRRLEKMGHLVSEWSREEETGRRRRRYYRLTESGMREAAVASATACTGSSRLRAPRPGLA